MSYQKWLMKTEPNTYSIDDLASDGSTQWEGIRNYQARNFMMNDMTIGDDVLIYHSNAKPPGIIGLAKVCSEPYPDHFAWNDQSPYFDPKSPKSNPRWFMIDIEYVAKFSELITLDQLKKDPKVSDMMVLKKGMRLSIQPVSDDHFNYIVKEYGKK